MYENRHSARCAEDRRARATGERYDRMGHRLTECAAILAELAPVSYDVFRMRGQCRDDDPSEVGSEASPTSHAVEP